ncbi:hypothetical protein [Psychrobacillus sp. NPDC093180]|uniref:hypothetical protein n=1 Tax=Psychrobacillus sp. NPDC093180 TaxID=3364489 RepID=UPI0038000313
MKHFNKVIVELNGQAEEFCLATNNGWGKVVGHAVRIDNYHFSVVALQDFFRISELDSGAKMIDIKVPTSIQSYDEVMNFISLVIVPKVVSLIHEVNKKEPGRFEREVERLVKHALETCGVKPPTKKVML